MDSIDNQNEKAFFIPLTFLGFITTIGEGTDEERDAIGKVLIDLNESKEFQEKLFALSQFVSEKFKINFLMIPRYIKASGKKEDKDIVSSFIDYLGREDNQEPEGPISV